MHTIGIHTHITNPLSAGYLCYLACIKSWARFADEVIVVDGGSTDNSIGVLNEWLGSLSEKVRIIAPPAAHWGRDDRWEWPQIAINRQLGLRELSTDWAIHVDADHVAPQMKKESLLRELEMQSEALLLSLPILFYDNGEFLSRHTPRAWVLNLRKIRSGGISVAYGIDRAGGTHLDYPVRITSRQTFNDPDSGFEKEFFWGDIVPSEETIGLQPFSMGHFFFTPEQCMAKNLRLSKVSGRFRGIGPRTPFEIAHDLRFHRMIGCEKRNGLLQKPFPEDALQLMETSYSENMLGGYLYRQVNSLEERLRSSICLALRAARRMVGAVRRRPCLMNSVERRRASICV